MYVKSVNLKIFKKLIVLIACIIAFAMAFLRFGIDAFAGEEVTYWDGGEKKINAELITNGSDNLNETVSKWYVVKNDVTIENRVTVNGNVHLILADGAHLNAKQGIDVSEGHSLTIYGQSEAVTGSTGKIEANGEDGNAGIGGITGKDGGSIKITGGIIEANGKTSGAGIGGGDRGRCKVTITGGDIKASSETGAGIGAGLLGRGGNITITGGSIKAHSAQGAGIGGGHQSKGAVVMIRITGGEIDARSETGGAGIGGGGVGGLVNNGEVEGNVLIEGGVINASSKTGAGIGGGNRLNGTVTITEGVVKASSKTGAGIGGGIGANGSVTITGGMVDASSEYGAGIGCGKGGTGGTFSTGNDGKAVIDSTGISDNSDKTNWKGIIFDGNNGELYDDQKLIRDFEIKAGKILTIQKDNILTVTDYKTLTINGSLDNKGNIINDGNMINNHNIYNVGGLYNTCNIHNTVTGHLYNVGSLYNYETGDINNEGIISGNAVLRRSGKPDGYIKNSGNGGVISPGIISPDTSDSNSAGETGGGSSSKKGNDTSKKDKVTATNTDKVSTPAVPDITVKAKKGKAKTAETEISEKTIENALKKAKENNNQTDKLPLKIKVDMPKGTDKVKVNITESSLEKIAGRGINSLTVETPIIKAVFNKKAISEIKKQGTGDVAINIIFDKKLSKEAQKLIGKRPVYEISINRAKGKKNITDFRKGNIRVSVPYTLKKNEKPDRLYAVYLDKKGKPIKVKGSAYDSNGACITFKTNFLSTFGTAYTD